MQEPKQGRKPVYHPSFIPQGPSPAGSPEILTKTDTFGGVLLVTKMKKIEVSAEIQVRALDKYLLQQDAFLRLELLQEDKTKEFS